MKSPFPSLLFFISVSLYSQAPPYDFTVIDAYVKSIPKSEQKSINQLATVLTKTAPNDLEKVRAIYVWLGMNVAYDLVSFKTRNVTDQSPESVFKTKMAVCQGYSELFKKLCTLNNIPCELVSGYSKGFGYRLGKKFKATDHAWNAVKIDTKWYLVDATWGAGYVDENDNYVNMFTNEHFLTEPQKFILKHLPSDPIWQLMGNEVSLKTFEKDSNGIKKSFVITNPNINYVDTLSNWEKLDSTQKVVNSSLRIIRFNPDNSDAWYKMGWFYYSMAWSRMAKLNDPAIQRNKSLSQPLAQEAVYYLNEALKYMNEIGKRDPFYGADVKQKKEIIGQNLKSLQNFTK